MSAFRASMGGITMLVVKELSKKIGHKQILNNINLNIPKGSIYGIIGENGAGKTTLIRHLVGVYQGDTGFVELDGMRVYENPEAKARMVYIPDEFFDVFGRNVTIEKIQNDDTYFKLIVDTNPMGFRMWAMRNIDLIEVKRPLSLREKIKKIIKSAGKRYGI